MKIKHLALPFVALMLTVTTVTAQTAKDVFDKSVKLTYLGIDFTKAKIIGDAALKTDDIPETQYASINQKVVNEAKKYTIAEAFNREEVSTDIGPVNKRNAKIDEDNIKSDNSDDYQALTPDDVKSLVSGFDFNGKTGLGLLLVMEGFNKTKKEISTYVTLVDMKAKKVLFTERVTGSLGGRFGVAWGFANLYLTGVKAVIDDIEKKKFKEWKSTYGG
ncbi:hypothetical protein [Chitinophaga barathri]|uniref:DUF4410 domain-containing protein n=1 Tax=Chitinophaga barathri TaxID=1647451 RepID=A0A3N4N004_9BACT|nr:hypothetical protein [Chitinophaga barathri]RPD40943.1 hypothetical protein EG028_13080 [Chitinophaga barathri]